MRDWYEPPDDAIPSRPLSLWQRVGWCITAYGGGVLLLSIPQARLLFAAMWERQLTLAHSFIMPYAVDFFSLVLIAAILILGGQFILRWRS